MQKPDTTRTMPRGTSAATECCTEPACESGLRNNYYEGKRLTPDTFRVEQRYLNDRRHLLNRAIHGWGVVYGYELTAATPASKRIGQTGAHVRVGTGLALDACGRELLQEGWRNLALDDLIVIDDAGQRIAWKDVEPPANRYGAGTRTQQKNPDKGVEPTCWLLSVHYAEQSADGVKLTDACRCERHEWDHTCETVRYSLRQIPCHDCCHDDECGLACDCGTGPCCGTDEGAHDPDDPARQGDRKTGSHLPFKRGGCRCLCDHLAHLKIADDCGAKLCEIKEPCARVRVDLAHGVPLACLELWYDDTCNDWELGSELEPCGPRRLVKRNDLLFDLVRGCDLTRIDRIGWAPWHRREQPVSFTAFSDAFGPDGDGEPEYVTTLFWVRFSRPVQAKTLTADCIAMTVMSMEREGNWRGPQRVPIARIDTTMVAAQPGDPPNHVRSARLVIEGGWVEDALRGRGSVFFAETWIEIEVRGDFILDCNGQPIDANAVGLLPAPTGNGTPGGTFLSTFRVAPRDGYRHVPRDPADRPKGASS
jgi:hypothetical protein